MKPLGRVQVKNPSWFFALIHHMGKPVKCASCVYSSALCARRFTFSKRYSNTAFILSPAFTSTFFSHVLALPREILITRMPGLKL